MKTQIIVLAFLVMVVALGATALPAMAAEDSSEGSFTLNNAAPNVTSVVLYELDETDTTTSMSPQTEYAVKIEAGDTNTLDDIRYVKVVIQKQTYSGSDHVSDQATYQYDRDATPKWSLIGPLSTTWSIDEPDCKVPGDITAMSGTWWLHFVPGKIAREATWDIEVTAEDDTPATDTLSQTGLSMQWYGELTATDTSFGFGSISLGDTDKPITTGSDTDVDVNTIANGAYKLETKSGDWAKGADTATLDWDGTLNDVGGEGHFALENDGEGSVGTSNYVQDSYNTVTDFVNKTAPTAEGGDNEPISVWVSVASTGFMPGTYNGTYNVQIATD